MCGDVEDAMTTINVRATYELGGWAVVVVAPAADGSGSRGLVTRVDAELRVVTADLWTAIRAAAGRSGIALPVTPEVAPSSPGAGVRQWRLAPPR